MNKFQKFLEDKLMPIAAYLNTNKVVGSLKDGMMAILPLMLFGSFVLILGNIPYLNTVAPEFVGKIQHFFSQGTPATLGLIGLAALISISYNYAKRLEISEIAGILTAVCSLIIMTNFTITTNGILNGQEVQGLTVSNVIPANLLGAEGMFTAMIISFVAIRLLAFFISKKWTIKMPESVPKNASESFASLIPMFLVFILFLVFRNILELTSFGTLQNAIYTLITKPLTSLANYSISIIILTFIQQILWFFGIHGTQIVMSVWGPIETTMTLANLTAFQTGLDLPYIATQTFREVYGVGGAQGILCAITAGFIVMKSRQAKAINNLSIAPAMFNIQEPYTFGMPAFMNPILLIPFVIIPVIQIGLAYFLCAIKFAPIPVLPVPWTTPIFISGLISTNFNVMGVATQVILFAVGMVIWIPFLKILDNKHLSDEKIQSL
ncbi:PTS sugar transporter subunit IIC [Clostridium vincentii]|uniref:Permease IIC component n=1 Tax=Clostridium vincentii TaxID=52704 RepID=A0A2T0BIH5_9CLOT|nr:PTS transporter subunit EIIC [Clostridium vincentii]PRR83602.1 Oligo-beta-mannoside permease IIC component [Clostridium vincentii]